MIPVLIDYLNRKPSPFPNAKEFLGHCPTQLTPCSKLVFEKNLRLLIAKKVATSPLKDKDPEVIKAMLVRDEMQRCVSKGKKYFPQKPTTFKQQIRGIMKKLFF